MPALGSNEEHKAPAGRDRACMYLSTVASGALGPGRVFGGAQTPFTGCRARIIRRASGAERRGRGPSDGEILPPPLSLQVRKSVLQLHCCWVTVRGTDYSPTASGISLSADLNLDL
jgi:hypothetical protein